MGVPPAILCPHCGVPLASESYEGVAIDRCPSCSGIWLDAGELTRVLDSREAQISPEVVRETLARATGGMPGEGPRTLVACPRCLGPMAPINYDHASGVVIDHCELGHGNWLDAGELERVQAHREHWDEKTQRPARDRLGLLLRSLTGR